MTRKDFEAIAGGLYNAQPRAPESGKQFVVRLAQWEATCATVADALRNTNPKFDRERFLKACGAV